MSKRFHWCHSCGRKKVIYFFDSRCTKKPFICNICKKRFSREDLDYKRVVGSFYVKSERVNMLSKLLMQHCKRVSKEKTL